MKWLTNLVAKIVAKKVVTKMGLEDGSLQEGKPWYKSKGVITGLVTVLIGIYEGVKVSLAPQMGWTLPEIPPLVYTILGGLGIYSRVVATKEIK